MISVVLTVLSVVLGLVLALLTVLVVVPTQVWAAGDVNYERLSGEAAVRWGLGLLTLRVSNADGGELFLFGVRVARMDLGDQEKKKKKREKKRKKKEKRKTEKKEESKSWFAWLRHYRRTLLRIAKRLLLTLDPRLQIAGAVGLGDPADTAAFFEIIRQLEAVAPDRVQIALRREWLDEELDIRVRFVALIWPLHALLVVVALLFESDTRRMLRAAMA